MCLFFLGTAIGGTHYMFTSPATISFDYDAKEAALPICINNTDSVHPGDRTILLQLQNPVGGPILDGKDILEITIVDNGIVYWGFQSSWKCICFGTLYLPLLLFI